MGYDWSTDLALGILESLRRILQLSIKRNMSRINKFSRCDKRIITLRIKEQTALFIVSSLKVAWQEIFLLICLFRSTNHQNRSVLEKGVGSFSYADLMLALFLMLYPLPAS